jgi:hypothetical protein
LPVRDEAAGVNPLRRTLVGLLATGVVGAGLAVAVATPARATVGTVDTGAAISRSEIVERALSWTTEPVPYSQTSYYPATAARTGIGHAYRQDCSGFVSMAWNLPGSAITSDLVSSTSVYDTRLTSDASLQRGDALGTSGHVVLFLDWSADDAGRHRYFDMVSESHTGTDASVATDQDLDGYWSTYVPYAFKHAVADVPRAVQSGGGRTDQVSLNPAGHIVYSWRTSPTGVWTTEDLTALQHLPVLRTAPAIASPTGGQLVVLGTGASGALLEFAFDGSTWTSRTLTTTGTTYGLDASSSAGRVDVVGRQVGTTAADGTGTLWYGYLTGATWSGWLRPGSAPSSLIGDPAVADGPGVTETVVESANGTLLYGTWDTAATTWTWTAPFGTVRVPTQPAVSRWVDGTVAVQATIGGVRQEDILPPHATTWTGWEAPTPAPILTGPLAVVWTPTAAARTAAAIHRPRIPAS